MPERLGAVAQGRIPRFFLVPQIDEQHLFVRRKEILSLPFGLL
jgi:hypothetical protein